MQAASAMPQNQVSPIGLVRATVLTLLATAAVLAGMLALVNRADWWRGFLAASIVSALSAAASLPPLLLSLRKGLNQRLAGFFSSSGLRALISLGGCVLAIKAGNYPAVSTMLLMTVFYFAILAVETTYIAKSMWDTKA